MLSIRASRHSPPMEEISVCCAATGAGVRRDHLCVMRSRQLRHVDDGRPSAPVRPDDSRAVRPGSVACGDRAVVDSSTGGPPGRTVRSWSPDSPRHAERGHAAGPKATGAWPVHCPGRQGAGEYLTLPPCSLLWPTARSRSPTSWSLFRFTGVRGIYIMHRERRGVPRSSLPARRDSRDRLKATSGQIAGLLGVARHRCGDGHSMVGLPASSLSSYPSESSSRRFLCNGSPGKPISRRKPFRSFSDKGQEHEIKST